MKVRQYNFPIDLTLQVIGGRWKCAIVCHLLFDELRTGELLRRLAPISAKVLAEQLRELERDGLVRKRTVDGRPTAVYYSLTELGLTLRPVIDLMCEWGQHHLCEAHTPASLVLGHPSGCVD